MPSIEGPIPDKYSTDVVSARIGAQIVDVVCMSVQMFALTILLGLLVGSGSIKGFAILSSLTLPLYGGLLEGYWNGQTVGKRLLRIKVVDADGNDPTVRQAILRNLPAATLFSWAQAAVALAAIATSDRRQRVFDALADTYVVAELPACRGWLSWRSSTRSSPPYCAA